MVLRRADWSPVLSNSRGHVAGSALDSFGDNPTALDETRQVPPELATRYLASKPGGNFSDAGSGIPESIDFGQFHAVILAVPGRCGRIF